MWTAGTEPVGSLSAANPLDYTRCLPRLWSWLGNASKSTQAITSGEIQIVQNVGTYYVCGHVQLKLSVNLFPNININGADHLVFGTRVE